MASFEFQTPAGRFEVVAPDEQTAMESLARELASVASSSDDPEYSGLALNATAGLNEAIYGVLGAPVDLARGALNLGARGVNAVVGTDLPLIPENSFMGSRWIAEQAGKGDPVLDPKNTMADSTGERIARGVGQGVGYTVAPEAAVAGGIRSGVLTGNAANILARLFGSGEAAATNAAVGGAAGGGAVAASEAAPEGWEATAGVGGGLAAGGIAAGTIVGGTRLAKAGGRVIKDAAAPLTESGRTRLAGERLRDNASDFYALRESLDDGAPELVPGSDPTTFQAAGDMGVGAMERGAAARNPDLFNDRRAAQNAARVQALTAIQTEGAPETVAAAVRQQLKQIDDAAQAMIDDAAKAARGSAERVGPGSTPENAGTTLRGALEDARSTAKAAERALWEAVDPDGSLALPASNAKARAQRLVTDMPASAKTPSGEEKAIYDTLAQYDDVVPFSEVTALDSRLKAEMRAERLANGESPAYRRMSQLNAAIQNDLETAVAGKISKEADAVARGEMKVEETVFANLLSQREAWFAERSAAAQSGSGRTSSRGFAASGQAGVSGVRGTASEAVRGSDNPPRDPRLSADAANFDQSALDRLNTARQATRDRVETFDNRTLSPLRRRPSTVSNYDMPASAVPEKVFVAGPKGAETVQTFRNAVGDQEALDALQGFAVDRLRNTALRADGTLDPLKVAAFRKRYADALRAFPELDAKFADAASASQVMDDAIRQQRQTVAEVEKGVLGKIMRVEDPADVTRSVGSIFSAQDSAQRMLKLRNAIGGDSEAKRGLRKAVVDYMTDRFVGNTEAGTSGLGTMKSDAFQNFVKTNRAALRNAGFTDAEITTMTKIADDLQRANRSIASVKNPGGSNTAQDTLAVQKADSGGTILAKVAATLAAPGAGASAGYVVSGGNPLVAGAAALGAGVLAELRRHGLQTIDDIVTDALLNPDRARILLRNVSTPKQEELAVKELARMFSRSSVPAAAVSTSDNPPESVSAAAERAQQILLGGSASPRNHR